MSDLAGAAERLAERLEEVGTRIVLAESCTAGLVSASLAAIPGISRYLCGSFVVYRNASKGDWLGVPTRILDDPGPVSAEVAAALAEGALGLTQEADHAVAITGHLGPGAPPALDGVCYVGWQQRGQASTAERIELQARGRIERQAEAAERVLEIARLMFG